MLYRLITADELGEPCVSADPLRLLLHLHIHDPLRRLIPGDGIRASIDSFHPPTGRLKAAQRGAHRAALLGPSGGAGQRDA